MARIYVATHNHDQFKAYLVRNGKEHNLHYYFLIEPEELLKIAPMRCKIVLADEWYKRTDLARIAAVARKRLYKIEVENAVK